MPIKDNTIIVWTAHQAIQKQFADAVRKMAIPLSLPKSRKEFVNMTGMLIFADAGKITHILSHDDDSLAAKLKSNHCRLIIYGEDNQRFSMALQKLVDYAPEKLDKKYIASVIKASLERVAVAKKIKEKFKQKIFRIIHFHHLLNEEKEVKSAYLLELFGVTDRTLRRDLKVLRDVLAHSDKQILYDHEERAYWLS